MFILKKIGCRVFQGAFRLALPLLPYREPEIISSCSEMDKIFSKENTKNALVITDSGIVSNGLMVFLEAALKKSKINYAVYDKTQPNPTVDNVEEALKIYHENKCDTLIAIGGGSSMDCAKAVGARVVYPKKPLKSLMQK